jgi:hypothetical protein
MLKMLNCDASLNETFDVDENDLNWVEKLGWLEWILIFSASMNDLVDWNGYQRTKDLKSIEY